MSCSARLPVYIILVGLLFPESSSSLFNPKGMALFFLYILGILAALISAVALKYFMKSQKEGRLMLELPRYKYPNLKTVALTVYEKSRTFVVEAGKIILMISVVLWVLASYGPGNSMDTAAESVQRPENPTEIELQNYESTVASKKLRASYAGRLGQFIEPVIEPLGYDWKIGIALICSFAAREVFVSTIATLYAIGDDDIKTLQELLSEETDEVGKPVFTPAVIWSLLIFYAFAMQCMSTVAVVYRETKTWKIPVLQTVYMTVFAYLSSLMVYQLLS
jgi:ferrous iron transport protein B